MRGWVRHACVHDVFGLAYALRQYPPALSVIFPTALPANSSRGGCGMCDAAQEDRLDEIFARRRAEAEALWGKKLTLPEELPRWPPRHDVLNYEIGQRIRSRRSWAYVFQDQLARAVGISQSAL